MTTSGFKVLTLNDKGLRSPIANKVYKYLGEWTPALKNVRMCSVGWHLWTTRAAANQHFTNEARRNRTVLLFSAEGKGPMVSRPYSKKTAFSSIRLVKLLKVKTGTIQ